MKKLDLIILCGGKGTRLGKISYKTPKPLIKFGNKEFLEYLINFYQKYNFKNIFLLCCYKNQIFKKKFHNKFYNYSKVKVIIEKKPKDTAGALFDVKQKVKNNFLLINGDSYLNYDLNEFLNFKKKAKFKMLLNYNKNYTSNTKLNSLSINKKGQIIYKKDSNLMNSGIYYFNKNILNKIPNKKLSLEKEVIPELIKKKKIYAKKINGKFIDIGTKPNLNFLKKNYSSFFRNKAIFLDRDGVINFDKGYTHMFSKKIINLKTIKYLNKKTFKNHLLFIVTNQSGIGRGLYSTKSFHLFQNKMKNYLSTKNVFISDVEHCPHHPSEAKKKYKLNCKCRKPKTGMLEKLKNKWKIEKDQSFMIGDSYTDYLCAKKFKIKFKYIDEII